MLSSVKGIVLFGVARRYWKDEGDRPEARKGGLCGVDSCYERCVSKPLKSYYLKVIPSAFSSR